MCFIEFCTDQIVGQLKSSKDIVMTPMKYVVAIFVSYISKRSTYKDKPNTSRIVTKHEKKAIVYKALLYSFSSWRDAIKRFYFYHTILLRWSSEQLGFARLAVPRFSPLKLYVASSFQV